jgi:hypothetical protein
MGILLFSAAMIMPLLSGAADDYAFDTSETDKKPYSFGGYAEAKPILFALDRDAALYKTRFYNRDVTTPWKYDFTLQLDAGVRRLFSKAFTRVNNTLDYL